MPSSILLYPFIIRFNRALTPAATLLFPEVIIPCAPATGLTDVIILSLEVPEMDLFITVSLPWSTPRLLKPMVMSLHEPTRINSSTVEAGRFETLGAVATALSSISRNMHAMECTAFQLVKTGPLFSLLLLDVPDKFVVGAPPDEVRIHRRNIIPDDVVSDDEADLAPNTRCSSGRETLHYIRVDAQVCQNDFFSHVLCEARFYSDAGIKWWAGASVVRCVDEWKAQLYFESEEAAKLAARTLQNAWSNDELFVIIPAPICLDPSFTPSKLLPASSRWRVAFQPAQYFGDGGHTPSAPTALHPQASQSAAA